MSNRERNVSKENAVLDSALHSVESAKIARVVQTLPEEEASLSWRSQLNEKLAQTRTRDNKKKKIHRIWGYSTGLGATMAVAASVLFVVFSRPTEPNGNVIDSSIESQLLVAHKETDRSADVAGAGLSLCDDSDNSSDSKDVKWKEEDLEAL